MMQSVHHEPYGDLGLLLEFSFGNLFSTLDYATLKLPLQLEQIDILVSVAAFALFIGACGKSAQIPLYTWLPDAAGPTPVSALIRGYDGNCGYF
jgi:NADH-quinone oxidoreductase subunit L